MTAPTVPSALAAPSPVATLAEHPSPVRMTVAGFAPDLVPYDTGLRLQHEAADAIRDGASRGTLLLLEHEPVFTAGRRALPEEYPQDGTPVVQVDRGGKVTWHGPGQLVAYPVIKLRNTLGVVDFVRSLERVIIDTIAEFGVTGYRIDGRAGVWTGGNTSGSADTNTNTSATRPSKVAQIGIHTSDGIVTHGIAINCSNDLAPFGSFVPCGISDVGVTTLSRLTGRRITPSDVAPFLHARLSTAIEEAAA